MTGSEKNVCYLIISSFSCKETNDDAATTTSRGIQDKAKENATTAYQYQGYLPLSIADFSYNMSLDPWTSPYTHNTTRQTPSQPKAGLIA